MAATNDEEPTGVPLQEAQALAQSLIEVMRPFCQRCEIAGSIRRQKERVKDIEIVAAPRWSEQADPTDLFGGTRPNNDLFDWASTQDLVRWIKPGTSEIVPWDVKPDGKYWRGYLPAQGIKLDLFLTTPSNWGAIFLVRTGSALFSYEVVSLARRVGYRFAEGAFFDDRACKVLPVPEERMVFDHLGLEYVEPCDRIGAESLKHRKGSAR